MGILIENLRWLFNNSVKGGSMLELGNQFLYVYEKPWPEYPVQFVNSGSVNPVAKPFFKSLGYDHVSVDINGEDDALVHDMSFPFDLEKQFDVVTDFGTSEHVPSLYNCLLNIHNHTKNGGKIFHVNPLVGNWPGHGYWYRDEEFYKAYAKMTGYNLKDLHRVAACGNTTDGWNICAILEKNAKSSFPKEEDFNTLPIKKK